MSVCGARQKGLYCSDSSSFMKSDIRASLGRSATALREQREAVQGVLGTSTGKSPALSPGNNMGLCLVMSSGQVRRCGEMRKDGGRAGRGFHCLSSDFGFI